MNVYNFPDHIKGDTFKQRRITLGFDISESQVKMQFKIPDNSNSFFEWSTEDESFIVEDASQGILLMNKAILDYPALTYFYDLQVIDSEFDVNTYIKGSLSILNDTTT